MPDWPHSQRATSVGLPWPKFSLHPDLDASYFVREDVGSDAV